MPPECDGRCWEEDVKHPLASCDLEVVEGAITPEEADDVVAAAEAHAAVHGWHSQRHIAYPTRDLPWTALPSVARVFDKLWGAMEESVRRRCGVRPIDRLTTNDIFVVKYTPEGQAGLDRHRDASSFSFNAALSDPTSYGGGGTRIWLDSAVRRTLREKYLRAELEGVVRDGTAPGASAEARGAAARAKDTLDRPAGTLDVDGYVVRPDRLLPEDGEAHKIAKGSVMVQGGRNVHEGMATVSGTRYIVAGFVGLNRHCCELRYSGWRGVMALVRVTAMKNSARLVRDKVGGRVPLWDYVLYEEWRGIFARIRGGSTRLALLSLAAYAAWRVRPTRLSPRFNLALNRLFAGVVGYESSGYGKNGEYHERIRASARRRRRAMSSMLPTKHSLED